MRFTTAEMVFLNSITYGEDVFGIPSTFHEKNATKEDVVKKMDDTLEALTKKGVFL